MASVIDDGGELDEPEEETEEEPELDATDRAIAAVVAMPDTNDDASNFSSEDDSYDSDDPIVREYPYVPPTDSKLGPRMTELVQGIWYRVRAPLRRCYCTICVRAERAQTAQLQHMFMSVDGMVAAPGIRIA